MELIANVPCCALVFEGGGYRASYTAGIADVLLEQELYFPFVCGISAGASNTVNYLARDRRRVKWAFVNLAGDRRAGGMGSALRGNGYINADYIYEGLLDQGPAPLDFATLKANPAHLAMQAFERDTGLTHVWDSSDMVDADALMKRVRASSTLPWLMHPIELDGQVMLDGGLGKGAGIPLWLAERAGFDKFVFLATRPAGWRRQPLTGAMRRTVMALTEDLPYVREALLTRHDRYNSEMDRIERLERDGRCLVVRPDEMPVESTTFDVDLLERTFRMGRAHALRDLPLWRDFLFGGTASGPHRRQVATRPVTGSAGYVNIQGG